MGAHLCVVVAEHIQQRKVGARDLPVRHDVRQRDRQRHLQGDVERVLRSIRVG